MNDQKNFNEFLLRLDRVADALQRLADEAASARIAKILTIYILGCTFTLGVSLSVLSRTLADLPDWQQKLMAFSSAAAWPLTLGHYVTELVLFLIHKG